MSALFVTATVSGPVSEVSVRPHGQHTIARLGDLSVVMTDQQARRLLAELARQLQPAAAVTR